MSSYYGDSGRSVPSWDALDAGYDEDVLDQSEYQFANRDHVLFAIDAGKSMRVPLPDEENPGGVVRGESMFHKALKAIVDIERRKVITGPSDSIGILLYNVDPENSPPSSSQNYKPGTYVLQPLELINPESIKELIKIVQTADAQHSQQGDGNDTTTEPAILQELFPPCDPKAEVNIADVLVTCNFLFRDGGSKLAGNKRVFLITDNDDPPGSSNPAPARTVYGDLAAYGVGLNTCFLNRPNHAFDPRIYWNDILGVEEMQLPEGGMEMLEDMLTDMVIRTAPKRRQFTIPLRFGGRDGEIEIGVSGYSIISVQNKGQPKLVRMRGQKVEEVTAKTQYTSAETGADLDGAEITSAFQFGDESKVQNVLEPNWWETSEFQEEQDRYAEELLRLMEDKKGDIKGVEQETNGDGLPPAPSKITVRTRVQFSDKEIASFRSLNVDPQIKIIGFQSPDNLRLEDNVKHSYFVYPDENIYTGSTRTFTALLKSCLKLNKHALALCRFRTNATPEFCVLVPQKETFTSEGVQDDPPGFHVIVLPFVDDLRDAPKNMTDNFPASDDQTIAMEKIIRKLRFKSKKYQPSAWRNPALEYHQKQLQALAFDEDFDTDAFEDRALPKYAGIHKVAGTLMKEWNQLIADDERAVDLIAPATKRHVVQVDADDVEGVLQLYEAGNINKAKVNELRDYAKFHQISLHGKSKKADIIDVLEDHLMEEVKKKKSKK